MTTPRATHTKSGLAAFAHARGFTLIELMVVVGVIGVLLVLAAPSMQEMIQMRRLRAINAQLVTDVQLARSEAVARRAFGRIDFSADPALPLTCYTIYTALDSLRGCDCTLGPGQACSNNPNAVEIRTVQIPRSTGTLLSIPRLPGMPYTWAVGYEPSMGSLVNLPVDKFPQSLDLFAVDTKINNAKSLRTLIARSGKPTVCAPVGSTMDVPACP